MDVKPDGIGSEVDNGDSHPGSEPNRVKLAGAIDFALLHLLGVRLIDFMRAKGRVLLVLGCTVFFHFAFLNTETSCHDPWVSW